MKDVQFPVHTQFKHKGKVTSTSLELLEKYYSETRNLMFKER